ncbi:transketolase [Bacteroidia bacterium]|nr:transketolase [Bacteroidia bacterium]
MLVTDNIEILSAAADNIRILSAAMVEKARSGHPGGAMGGADFMNVLFSEYFNYDPSNPHWAQRDRFFLDPGHMSPMLYSTLALCGKFSMDELQQFRQWGSPTPGHPELDVERGIENTSGPLGQGHAMAVGAAIAERFLAAHFDEWVSHKTYAYISDGGVQEEISQGAGRLAGYLRLSNLIMFYDSNGIQLSSETKTVTSEDTAKKYESWGWNVIKIDGHDPAAIRMALTKANAETTRPTLIIGTTIMGKGAVKPNGDSLENQCCTHGMPLSEAGGDFGKTVANLGGNPANPFVIFDTTKKLYAKRRVELEEYVAEQKARQAKWEQSHPDLAAKYKRFYAKTAPAIDFSAIVQKENIATRAASSAVLAEFAKQVENMVVSSADLSNSDKTDGFLKHTKAFAHDDFSGAFLQMGVCELTMAAVMNGMALHGGIIPVCATFFVFSDYMKPAVRMAALMQLPVKYVWTHDAFRVGEDGPTHQPVEQEAQIRLMEQLKNHSGQNSMLVLRPADAAETTAAWKLALENTATPTALILSRQNIKDLPATTGNRYNEALQAARGAYIVKKADNPQAVLLANGSEVSTLIAAAELLESRQNLRVQIVSAPSEGLFFAQDADYRQLVILSGVPVFGLTAGLPSTLQRLAGKNGTVYGLDHFGYSAPAPVLDEKFGFTPESVYQWIVGNAKNV